MDNTNVSILLDIKSQIGALNANMVAEMRSRERMEKNLERLTEEVADIKPVVLEVAQMKPEVEELMIFKARIGSYIWTAGLIATGAMYLLWQGLNFFSDNIRAFFGKLFH